MIVFEAMARKHWTKHLPAMTAGLKSEGIFEETVKEAAEQAVTELDGLLRSGVGMQGAREIVLQEYILLPPETDDDD